MRREPALPTCTTSVQPFHSTFLQPSPSSFHTRPPTSVLKCATQVPDLRKSFELPSEVLITMYVLSCLFLRRVDVARAIHAPELLAWRCTAGFMSRCHYDFTSPSAPTAILASASAWLRCCELCRYCESDFAVVGCQHQAHMA